MPVPAADDADAVLAATDGTTNMDGCCCCFVGDSGEVVDGKAAIAAEDGTIGGFLAAATAGFDSSVRGGGDFAAGGADEYDGAFGGGC